uniref:EGF-like domain-containing protein n=1 Tax=Steinernema glaseri TaxID=37863 RepID=A0A1I8APG3_9BILA
MEQAVEEELCLNGGTMLYSETYDFYYCSCPADFTGPICLTPKKVFCEDLMSDENSLDMEKRLIAIETYCRADNTLLDVKKMLFVIENSLDEHRLEIAYSALSILILLIVMMVVQILFKWIRCCCCSSQRKTESSVNDNDNKAEPEEDEEEDEEEEGHYSSVVISDN